MASCKIKESKRKARRSIISVNIVIILNNVIPGCINCEYSHNSCEQLV